MKALSAIFLGGLIALGIGFAGFSLGSSLYYMRQADRFVSVKGVAERKVKADLAQWKLQFRVVGSELHTLYDQIAQDQKKVMAFLQQHSIPENEIITEPLKVTDRKADTYQSSEVNHESRYILEATVQIYSKSVDKISNAALGIGKLVRDGVAFANTYDNDMRPVYRFTQLDTIRPEMIAEAIKSAKRAAEQFVQESKSCLGPIRKAQQGYFQVASPFQHTEDAAYTASQRESNISVIKRVRVVMHVDFFLQ